MADMTPRDRARQSVSLFHKRMSEINAGDVAQLIGWSDSKLSKLKTDHMDECLTLLAHIGLRIVPAHFRCIDEAAFRFLTQSHARVVQKDPTLPFGGDE